MSDAPDTSSLQQLILETADEGFCLFSAGEAKVIAHNQRFASIFAFDESWLEKGPSVEAVAIAVYERQKQKVRDPGAHIQRILDYHRQPGDREIVLELNDGRFVTGRTAAAPTGERLYTFRDVTAERLVLRELQAERERLSMLVEHAPVAYYVIDPQSGRTRQLSRSIKNLTGKEAEAFLNDSHEWVSHIHPDDRELVMRKMERAVDSFTAFDLDYRYQHADGSYRWVREIAEPIVLAAGIPEQIAGVVIDITRQKVAETNLRESERRFRTLIEGMPDLIFYEHDVDRRLTYVSPSVYQILGFRPEEMIGHRFEDFRPRPERDRSGNSEDPMELARQMVQEAIRTKHRQPLYEVNLWGKDGRPIAADIVEYPVIDEDDQVIAFRGVARDVTSLRDMQRRLRERERLAILGTFAGGLAHDLNNLLLPIRAALDVLERAPDTRTVRERAAAIRLATNHIAELTRKLLIWTRHESSSNSTSKTIVSDVTRWAEHAIEFFREAVSTSGKDEKDPAASHDRPAVKAALEIKDPPSVVMIDPDLLQQAVLNLFLNARDAMSEGGTVTLTVSESPKGWHAHRPRTDDAEDNQAPETGARFVVRDEGVGMDASVMERAFDPFFSTKARGKSTGLGLALVHSIITSFGGRVRIESTLGKGTSIILDVPARRSRRGESSRGEAATGATSESEGRCGGALVGLRDPRIAAYIRTCLRQDGFTARIDADGRPGPGDLVWVIDVSRVEPVDVRSMVDSLPDLVVISLSQPDERPGWPDGILWLDGPVDARILRTRIREVVDAPRDEDEPAASS